MNTPSIHVESRWHFGIPILDTDIPNFNEHQQNLINAFQKLRADDSPDMVRSNQGGWHSLDNLHLSKDPDIHWLTQEILRIGTHSIMRIEGADFKGKVSMTNLWVNINGAGNWNMPHSHLPNEWSGVAYISVNEVSTKQNERDGDLIFINPMPMGKQYKRPASISYTPRNGKLFLFPGYLLHMVAPHNDSADRISVAFNFKLN